MTFHFSITATLKNEGGGCSCYCGWGNLRKRLSLTPDIIRLFLCLVLGTSGPIFLYLGPPRSANVVILRGERRNSGKLNAPSAFRSCKLVPTPFPAPRDSVEYKVIFL